MLVQRAGAERRRPTRRAQTIAAVVTILLACIGVANAYWGTDGPGTSTVPVAPGLQLTPVQTSVLRPLLPGGVPQGLAGNFDNDSGSPIVVTDVTVSIDRVTKGIVDPAIGCDSDDFTITDPVMVVGHPVASGLGVDDWAGATLAFDNRLVNQDACKGATVHLSYAAGVG